MQRLKEYLKLDYWTIIPIIIIALTVIARVDLESSDVYFMIAHGEDMLQNGLVRYTDIFSMHSDLSFMYQKWGFCILVYLIHSIWGMAGCHIASNILSFSMFLCLYKMMNHLSPKTKKLNIVIMWPIMWMMLNHAVLRPHTLAVILLIWELMLLEKYVRKKVFTKSLYIQLFAISLCMMWIHSTMWYMCIIFLLPYLCDTKYIVDGIKMNDYPIVKNVTYVPYNKKPLLIGLIWMLVASLLQPYGIYQYKYMFICLTASGEKYSHIGELQALRLFDKNTILMAMVLLIITILAYKYKCVHLRCFYMGLGGLIMACFAQRLLFYSCILFVVVICNQLDSIMTDELMEHIVKTARLKMILGLICFLCVGCVGVISYVILSLDLLEMFDNMLYLPAVDILVDNVDNLDDLKVYTEPEAGSYLIYKGGHPYIDCRAEVYDIALNDNKDILYEFHLLLYGVYKNEIIDDTAIVQQFQADYDFDYYIIPSHNVTVNNLSYLYDKIRDTAYCNYKNESFGIYSYKHDVQFAN